MFFKLDLADLKEPLTILLSSVTAAIAIFNWRAGRFRAKLKDDFEILRRYREEFGEKTVEDQSLKDDKEYRCLRNKIHGRMHKAYVVRRIDVSDVISAAAFFLSAVVAWLLLPAEQLPNWRAGIIIILVGVGFAFLYAAFKDRGQERI